MILDVGNPTVKLVSGTPEERAWLRDYLSFKNGSARFTGGKLRLSLFDDLQETFPAGFLPLVMRAAPEESPPVKVELLDRREKLPAPDPLADLAWLRDYQLDAVKRVVERHRGILHMPTGAGKTEVAAGLTRALPARWLFLVHRTTLMAQAADRYTLRTGLPAGRLGEGLWLPPPAGRPSFCAATFQTLFEAWDRGDPRARWLLEEWTEGLCVDECHVLPASSFWRVAMATNNAAYRVGLSGTPLARGDQRSQYAIAALGPVIYRVRPELLIERGVLARPKIRMVPFPQKPAATVWDAVYREAIVRSAGRNDLVVACALKAPAPLFVFVKEVAHGREITRKLARAGLRARFVWGAQDTAKRTAAVNDLVGGKLDAIVCSVVFQEGLDVPSLRSVIVASGGKSVIASLQRVGRGMRVERDASGTVVKDTFQVFDIEDIGCGCRHDDDGGKHKGCEWLEGHAKQRLSAYAGEGYEVVRGGLI